LAQSRRVRAVAAAWQSRIARGLCVDAFGQAAVDLRQLVLTNFDHATRSAIVLRPAERAELRQQLQQLVDGTIQQAFQGQVTNLEKATLKRFQAALLKTLANEPKESAESIMTQQAAAMRKEALLFETRMGELEVPDDVVGGCTKDAPLRELAAKLNDAWQAFPDSPVAKLHRTQQVTRVVNQEKSPGERSVRFGLDLVAMLRPDGFGSLQGFAGYQLPGGNSITFGVHNDADDPQVIAQFGGVRPPLLRVQPKLRVDVEL
jgi:Root hair defective 3 GTP-binding protein (RHD3)